MTTRPAIRALVAIPCFNERANILRTLDDLLSHLLKGESLVVDNGSADDTAAVVRAARATTTPCISATSSRQATMRPLRFASRSQSSFSTAASTSA